MLAVACTCYLRAEFNAEAHLTYEDVRVESLEKPRLVRVRVKESMTDR